MWGALVRVAQQKKDVSIPAFELSARHRSQRSSGFCSAHSHAAIMPQHKLVMSYGGGVGWGWGVRQRHGCKNKLQSIRKKQDTL